MEHNRQGVAGVGEEGRVDRSISGIIDCVRVHVDVQAESLSDWKEFKGPLVGGGEVEDEVASIGELPG